LSLSQNPGNLKTNLLRTAPKLMRWGASPLLYKPIYGAYTELWTGLSPELTMADNGGLVIPWGRLHPAPRADLLEALKSEKDGGTGRAAEFREWCEEQVKEFR